MSIFDSNQHLVTRKLLETIGATEECIDWWIRNVGENFSVSDIPLISGDFLGHISYMKDRFYNGTFDDQGNMIQYEDIESGQVFEYTYDEHGNKLTCKNSSGFTEEFVYDEHGNIVVKDSCGLHTQYTYDDHGNKLTLVDSNGYSEEYTYDERGNMLRSVDSRGYSEEYTYDEHGNALTRVDNNGYFVEWTYDEQGNILTRKNRHKALGNNVPAFYTVYSYDSRGNRLTRKTSTGEFTEYIYDRYENLLMITSPDGVCVIPL
jgi:YD repeat-containing protein